MNSFVKKQRTVIEMTLTEFIMLTTNPGVRSNQRFGQMCFNILAENHPELAEKIRTTETDPFYVPDESYLEDPRMKKFFVFLLENLEKV
jgi:hypothetical protein